MLLQIFISFFITGATTFGGGYSMLPILTKEIVIKRGWIGEIEILDYYSISQCLPGLIAVNTSLFIGKKLRGIPGAVVAMLGIITPSIIVIVVIASLYVNFIEIPVVGSMFAGIRIAVGALITGTVIRLIKQSVKKLPHLLLFAGAFLLMIFSNLSPIWVVVFAAPIGILLERVFQNA